MVYAPTGLGKTNFLLAIAIHIAAGKDFLHWRIPRAARVLYVDGEMPDNLAKQRITDAIRRLGGDPANLLYFNRNADFPDMPPLNYVAADGTMPGVVYMEQILADIEAEAGKVDLITFDNIQSLLIGNMSEEEPWRAIMPWIDNLTRRKIGQIWVHHTGNDANHSYGTKLREWQLDTIMAMVQVDAPEAGADICFDLNFTTPRGKARMRTPANRADYEGNRVSLTADQWKLTPGNNLRLRALAEAAEAAEQLQNVVVAAVYATRGHDPQSVCAAWPYDDNMELHDKLIRQNTTESVTIPSDVHTAIDRAIGGRDKPSNKAIRAALDAAVTTKRLTYHYFDKSKRDTIKAGYDVPEGIVKPPAPEPLFTNETLKEAVAAKAITNPGVAPKVRELAQRLGSATVEGLPHDIRAEFLAELEKLAPALTA